MHHLVTLNEVDLDTHLSLVLRQQRDTEEVPASRPPRRAFFAHRPFGPAEHFQRMDMEKRGAVRMGEFCQPGKVFPTLPRQRMDEAESIPADLRFAFPSDSR